MNFRQNLFYEYVSICKFVSCILIICNLHLPLNDQMSDNHINRRQTRLLARHSYLSTPSVKNAYRLAGSSCFAIALLLSCSCLVVLVTCREITQTLHSPNGALCFALTRPQIQTDASDLAMDTWQGLWDACARWSLADGIHPGSTGWLQLHTAGIFEVFR